MKIFLDTEFTGLKKDTELISLGMVAEDNTVFYAEFNDYSKDKIDDWLKNNVICNLKFKDIVNKLLPPHLPVRGAEYICKGNTEEIKNKMSTWLNLFNDVDLWADCCAYDYVLFAELFNGSLNMPDKFQPYIRDLFDLFISKGFSRNDAWDMNREDFIEGSSLFKNNFEKHNALWDAKVCKECHEKLMMFV